MALDAEGKFKADACEQINVLAANADAVAYSETFDRLYVAVDKEPGKKP